MLYLYDGQDENAETILQLQFENAGKGFVNLVKIWMQSVIETLMIHLLLIQTCNNIRYELQIHHLPKLIKRMFHWTDVCPQKSSSNTVHIVFKSDDTDDNSSLNCSSFYAEEFGASFELEWYAIEDISSFQQLLSNTGSVLN